MSGTCGEMQLLLQADHDGELDAAAAARVAAHLAICPSCAAQSAALRGLSARLHSEIVAEPLPESLRTRVARSAKPAVVAIPRRQWPGFAAGLALAACVALVLLPRRTAEVADAAVAAHIRALQPGHLLDVVSTDQHTVKPWFAGKLDYSPPVRDLAAAGFPLQGGRLDYLNGRAVAALVYARAKHVIDVEVWPGAQIAPLEGTSNGYNFIRWSADGMVFWAVSDLNRTELRSFVRLMQGGA